MYSDRADQCFTMYIKTLKIMLQITHKHKEKITNDDKCLSKKYMAALPLPL